MTRKLILKIIFDSCCMYERNFVVRDKIYFGDFYVSKWIISFWLSIGEYPCYTKKNDFEDEYIGPFYKC